MHLLGPLDRGQRDGAERLLQHKRNAEPERLPAVPGRVHLDGREPAWEPHEHDHDREHQRDSLHELPDHRHLGHNRLVFKRDAREHNLRGERLSQRSAGVTRPEHILSRGLAPDSLLHLHNK